MPRPVHFEIHCDDVERAVKFFESVFAWKINKWEGPMDYWLVSTGEKNQPGIDGGMMKRQDPAGTVYNTIDVPDLDEYMEKVTSAGGQIVLDKQAVPGVGWFCYFKDTEGNVHGMMQEDLNAK